MAVNQAFDTPLERLGLLPNGMNWRGDWDATEQYYLNDVVRSPANLSSYILNGRDALRGGADPTLNPDWIELSSATTGVQQVNAGFGIALDPLGTATNPIIDNTGILTITAGAGIGVVGGGTTGVPPFNATITNTGVIGVGNGLGINITGTPTNPIINNNGVRTLTAGAGINVNNGDPNNPVISNTGVTSIVSGGGLTITNPTGPAVTITNDGVIQVNAGTGISITGTQAQPVINTTLAVPVLGSCLAFPDVPLGNSPQPIPAGGNLDVTIGLQGFMATSFAAGVPDPNGTWILDMNEIIMYAPSQPSVGGTLTYTLFDAGGNSYIIPDNEGGENYVLGGNPPNVVVANVGVIALPVSTIRGAGLTGITTFRITNNLNVPFYISNIAGRLFATYYPNGIQ